MGEMADMFLDFVDDCIEGGIASFYTREPHRRQIFCKNCKAGPLRWKHTDDGWRLYGLVLPHKCPPVKGEKYLDPLPKKSRTWIGKKK